MSRLRWRVCGGRADTANPRVAQGALGAAASEAAKQLSHSLTFAINLAVLTNLTQHTYARTGRVGPTLLVVRARVADIAASRALSR